MNFVDAFSIFIVFTGLGAPLLGFIFSICCPSVFPAPPKIWALLFVWTIATGISSLFLKRMVCRLFPHLECIKRPRGACDCDIFISDGDQSERPGFPSGHSSMVGMYAGIMIFLSIHNLSHYSDNSVSVYQFLLAIFMSLTLIILNGYARVEKRCHNWLQVAGGTAWGIFIGAMFVFLHIYPTRGQIISNRI